jgi:hypothetical protein
MACFRRRLALAAVLGIALLLYACGAAGLDARGGVTHQFAPDAGSAPFNLASLPQSAQSGSFARSASAANNYICGALFWRKADTGASTAESSLLLDATGMQFTWAIYSWGGLSAANYPVDIRPGLGELNTQFWLAFSDYKHGCWRFSGPHLITDVAIPIMLGPDMVSPEGCAYMALIAAQNQSLSLNWVNLTTSLDSGKVYVDASAAAPGDGSAEHPYPALETGVAAAQAGDTVVVAPGTYNPPDVITISKDLRIEGAGACRTQVRQVLSVENPPGTAPVVIDGLRCIGAGFSNAYPAKTELQLFSCVLETVTEINWSEGHRFLAQGCVADMGDPTADAFRFAYGPSDCVSTVRNCQIVGVVEFATGDGPHHLVQGNTIHGSIFDKSGDTASSFLANTIINGSITDKSGGVMGVDDEIIQDNRLLNSYIYCTGRTARIESNFIDLSALDPATLDEVYAAITCKSGTPTNIIGNTVLAPLVPFDGDLYDEAGEFAAIDTAAGAGVIEHNQLYNGSFGIYSTSGATSISYNTLSGMPVGLYGRSHAGIISNRISGCTIDGMILDAGDFIIQGNTVSGCQGSAIRIGIGFAPNAPDLGGGALGSLGRNVITGYGEYALVLETLAADVPQVSAKHNYWGTSIEAQVAAAVFDAVDNASLSQVDYLPFLAEKP